jgi:hypothetical protein
MKLLREYIRELLVEAPPTTRKTIDDLPEGVVVEVEDYGHRTDFNLSSSYDKERNHKPYGVISIQEPDDVGACGGAWVIAMVAADQGWGPFLYDIAMEWATMNHNGLTSDRDEVSAPARKVWNYYLTQRAGAGGDVVAHQLDDEEADTEESCVQTLPREFEGDDYWKDSPLSKRYTKSPPTTIDALKLAKKWDER